MSDEPLRYLKSHGLTSEAAATAFTVIYRRCAEHAWCSGRGDEFILMLETLRSQHGVETYGDAVNHRLVLACGEEARDRYAVTVTLSMMALATHKEARMQLMNLLLDWSSTIHEREMSPNVSRRLR